MMKDRGDAILYIKAIQNGSFDRNAVEVPKGSLAKRFWDDPTFSYGMEYGAILALMDLFDISKDEL